MVGTGKPAVVSMVLNCSQRARVEPAEALAGPELEAGHPPESATAVAEAPVAGPLVPHGRVGLTLEVLAPDYQRLGGGLEAEAGGSGLRARSWPGGWAWKRGRRRSRGCGRRGSGWWSGAGWPRNARGVHAGAGCRVTFRLRWRARRRPVSMVIDHRTAASLLSGRVS